jgi:hypothetical protein
VPHIEDPDKDMMSTSAMYMKTLNKIPPKEKKKNRKKTKTKTKTKFTRN